MLEMIIRVHKVLKQLGIDIQGSPSSVLPRLIDIINSDRREPYLFLWTSDGKPVAHGKYPQIAKAGSVLVPCNAAYVSSIMTGTTPEIQEGVLILMRDSISFGRVVSFPWIGGLRHVYVLRLLIGGNVYIFGA